MTDTVQVAIIASIGPTMIGLLNIAHQMMVSKKVSVIGDGVKRVETQTNGIKDALVAATTKVAHAEGVKDEKLRASLELNEQVGDLASQVAINTSAIETKVSK
jgi:hypothetical protein